MPAYLIGTIRVTEPSLWQEYVDRVGATFVPHKGKVLLRAVKGRELAGSAHGDRIVVAEFPDIDSLESWHASPEYQALISLRQAGADVVLTAYQT